MVTFVLVSHFDERVDVVDCSGFDETVLFHIDVSASGWRNNLAKDCLSHVVVGFWPSRFGGERLEASDELVCTSH